MLSWYQNSYKLHSTWRTHEQTLLPESHPEDLEPGEDEDVNGSGDAESQEGLLTQAYEEDIMFELDEDGLREYKRLGETFEHELVDLGEQQSASV